jgi:hypothetical protein
LGLGTVGAIQSPSSSSSHSSGFSASKRCEKWIQDACPRENHTRVGDSRRLIIEPALRLGGLLVDDLVGCVLIPVLRLLSDISKTVTLSWRMTNLGSFRIRNSLLVNPVRRLSVLGVVDFLGWVDGGLKVLQEAAGFLADAVDEDFVGVVGSTKKIKHGVEMKDWKKHTGQ